MFFTKTVQFITALLLLLNSAIADDIQSKIDLKDGKKVYDNLCKACHSENGIGTTMLTAASLNGVYSENGLGQELLNRILSGSTRQYFIQGSKLKKIEHSNEYVLESTSDEGNKYFYMGEKVNNRSFRSAVSPSFSNLSDKDIASVANYIGHSFNNSLKDIFKSSDVKSQRNITTALNNSTFPDSICGTANGAELLNPKIEFYNKRIEIKKIGAYKSRGEKNGGIKFYPILSNVTGICDFSFLTGKVINKIKDRAQILKSTRAEMNSIVYLNDLDEWQNKIIEIKYIK